MDYIIILRLNIPLMIKNTQIILIVFAVFCFCVVDSHPIAALIGGCALAIAAGLDHVHDLIKYRETLENDLYERGEGIDN